MSQPTIALFNSLEEILSTDLNRVGGLAGKAVMDSLLALIGGIDVTAPVPSVVRRGLLATPGGGLSTNISAGELMQFVAGAVADQSLLKLGAILAQVNVVHAAADPVNPRIDRISVTINTLDTDLSSRLELVLPARTVQSVNVNKTRNPNLVFTVTTGTPGANPVAPATPAGSTALWDVYIPANAANTIDNNYMDLRKRFSSFALLTAHLVERGLLASTATGVGLTSLTISAGRAWANGGLLEMTADQSLTQAQLSNNGASAANSTEYHVYAIVKGSGDPVGKNITDGVVFVTSSVAPGIDGRPSSPVTYRPFFNGGLNNVLATTTNALYLGTVHTDGTANYESGGAGIAISRDGKHVLANDDPHGAGWCGNSSGWVKRPTLSYVDANTVAIGNCAPVIGGQIGIFTGANANFAGNLVAGEVRAGTKFYYVYLRRAVSQQNTPGTWTRGAGRAYILRISNEAPNAFLGKPTPEAGFQGFEYVFVGSFLDVGGAAIRQFMKIGPEVYWDGGTDSLSSGALSDEPARTAITVPNMPGTSKLAIVTLTCRVIATDVAGKSALVGFNIFGLTGLANPIATPEVIADLYDNIATWMDGNWTGRIPLTGGRQFEMSRVPPSGHAGRALAASVVAQAFGSVGGYVEELDDLG